MEGSPLHGIQDFFRKKGDEHFSEFFPRENKAEFLSQHLVKKTIAVTAIG